MLTLYNMHTHAPSSHSGEGYRIVDIINTTPLDYKDEKDRYLDCWLSCGIHPWHIADSITQIHNLKTILTNDKQIIVIGEAGLDRVHGASLVLQLEVFEQQIELAMQYSKPIIIHCVKCWDELIAVKRNNPTQNTWIIHGYRGNEQQMKQLVNSGFSFSLGGLFNELAVKKMPIEVLFCETDDRDISILDVYTKVAQTKSIELEYLTSRIEVNINKTFFGE